MLADLAVPSDCGAEELKKSNPSRESPCFADLFESIADFCVACAGGCAMAPGREAAARSSLKRPTLVGGFESCPGGFGEGDSLAEDGLSRFCCS